MKIKPFWIEDLSDRQCREILEIVLKAGYVWVDGTSDYYITTRIGFNGEELKINYDDEQTITYQEFMDLYGTQEENMNKCGWENGKFDPCDAMGFSLHHNLIVYKMDRHKIEIPGISTSLRYCPCCGADIKKPEPQVIIKKSCETWVARYDGVDYLCFDELIGNKQLPDNETVTSQFLKTIGTVWKPISEIEITDEIAKRRPMVVVSNKFSGREHDLKMLIHVKEDVDSDGSKYVSVYKNRTANTQYARLATVDDLEGTDE
jgi:hypothetical protein